MFHSNFVESFLSSFLPRPPGGYRRDVIIGLDVGGTKALGLLVDPADGTIHGRQKSSSAGDGPTLVRTLATMVNGLRSDHAITGIGLGIAGLIDRSGTVRYSPNLADLVEFPVTAELTAAIGHRVVATNDATAGTWAEAKLGAGRGCRDFVYVALGTGIGAGFVINGELVLGSNGFAGEVGHMVIEANGPAHITGQQGPWEYYASGNALGRLARDAAAAGAFPAAVQRVDSIDSVTGYHVVELMRSGDSDALSIFDGFCKEVALGTSNLVISLDFGRVVIGGGLADIGEPLRAGVEYWLGELLLGREHRPEPEVVLAELGSDAAALGAAYYAIT
jgi:glucokinase